MSAHAHTLFQDAVLRAASRQNGKGSSTAPSSDNEDAVMTTVHSPLTSPPTQSRASSPPPAPQPSASSPTKTGSRAQSRVGLRQKREAAAQAKRASRDPLRRLPTDLAIRVFSLVGFGADGLGGNLDGKTFSAAWDLLNCGLVCKKWKDSPTINYVWYKLYHKQFNQRTIVDERGSSQTWTRKDSKTDWRTKYSELNATKTKEEPVGLADLDIDAGPTEKELREAKWEEERISKESVSKADARAFYKELGGRKLRDKTGKNWGADRTGWDDQEYFE